jgi:16S rRNA (guanine(1405)-N(7))-methyltransferase
MDDAALEQVIQGVIKNPDYKMIDPGLVKAIAATELAKGRSNREAIKQTRAKLHQVGKAYQEKGIPVSLLTKQLQQLPRDPFHPDCRQFSLEAMRHHRSTAERLPILENLYHDVFSRIPTIHRVLDLACGLNPLSIPWMNLPGLQQYWAIDIYSDMVGFLQSYFDHMHIPGTATVGNLVDAIPEQHADLVLLLKTIPCLEQVEKNIAKQLLDKITAPFILVSYPGKSLGGRTKGMPEFYTAQFHRLCEGKGWIIRQWSYPNELVFLIEK